MEGHSSTTGSGEGLVQQRDEKELAHLAQNYFL